MSTPPKTNAPAAEVDEDNCGHVSDPLAIRADDDKAVPLSHGSRGVIAVDMDDVLCNTNSTIVDMHHKIFPEKANPPITIEEFHHYLYWHNRGWGTKMETIEMVAKLYQNGLMERPSPIPGAKEGLLKLKEMGYKLIIITARSETQREGTETWIEEYYPDIFEELHFTGAFNHLIPATRAEHAGHAAHRAVVSHKKRSKHEVMQQTGALVLIDDSSDNALAAAAADPPARVLLFGQYPWNAEIIPPADQIAAAHDSDDHSLCRHEDDQLLYIEAEEKGLLEHKQERRERRIARGWLPKGVERVRDWSEVVAWVSKHLDPKSRL